MPIGMPTHCLYTFKVGNKGGVFHIRPRGCSRRLSDQYALLLLSAKRNMLSLTLYTCTCMYMYMYTIHVQCTFEICVCEQQQWIHWNDMKVHSLLLSADVERSTVLSG